MRVKMTLVATALAGLTMVLLSGSAAADTIKVPPGGSIQEAINQADEGDTVKLAPGTYTENVQIKTKGLTLKGAGPDETTIQAPATPADLGPTCDGAGICVSDATDPTAPPSLEGVRVKDLKVTGFAFSGVFFFATIDQRVTDVLAEGNQGYGIAAFNSTGGRYWDNVTPRNGEAGLYVGDSENANAVVRDNVSNENQGFGIFIRDAAHGLVEDNQTFDNCIGILFLDTPDDPAAPLPNSDWIASDNSANHNNAACSGDEGDASGIGIVISGAHRITLVDNTANGNQPSGPTPGSGGIVVLTEPGPDSPAATDNVIEDNTAFGNLPADLFWDQQGNNTFTGNRCETSSPDGLCVKGGDGDGDGHHGNDGDDDDHGDNGDHGDKQDKHKEKHGEKHHKSTRNKHV